jgi:superoxide dismutase, Fe-Mn family
MPFTLPNLPYDYNALEPYIDAETMRLHHTKHHQTYVDKLNTALEAHPTLLNTSLEELLGSINDLPETVRTAVKNHGGGHHNHSLFWNYMSPQKSEPTGPLTRSLEASFGSLDDFKKTFTLAAANHFGSGWAWLVIPSSQGNNDASTLSVTASPNQDSPLMLGQIPLLGLDVWEHAYYLKYNNRRPEYIESWWNVVNWREVEKQYDAHFSK